MWRALVVAGAALAAARALSIGAASDNATAQQTSSSEFYPDWVPFKNKHGEDLGEFVEVQNKPKPKKRLAPPVNFILRAVAEPEGDDYYDKGQGESDNEDDFEKKEWSDLHRGAGSGDGAAPLNHTDISDIDGVVSIITREPTRLVLDALHSSEEAAPATASQHQDDVAKSSTEGRSAEVSKTETAKKEDEDDNDYEESDGEKPKPQLSDEERRENEAKKAKILNSVDELKERHAEEQKLISERIKEEEMYKEERERDGVRPQEHEDKYSRKKTAKKMMLDYDEYDDDTSASLENKYEVLRPRLLPATRVTPAHRKDGDKHSPPGKQSVFKNPRLYVSYDDDSDESTSTAPATSALPTTNPARRGKERFSAKYRSSMVGPTPTPPITPATEPDDEGRISLVPDDTNAKEGEPTRFFPKKKKGKKRRMKTTSTPAAESSAAESATDMAARASSLPAPSAGDIADAVSAAASLAASTSAVTDAVPASTQHDDKKKSDDYEEEKGGGREYHSQHEEEHAEHGNKAYEGYHEDSKTAKGHTDKESHSGQYNDRGGVDEEHHDEAAHYGAHRHEEHGKKQAKYEESGKHSKGHSTKGSHDIHKKEEYEKNVEFFEEEGDSAEDEKHGGYQDDREHETGGHFKVGGLEATHQDFAKGESGHFDKGGHLHTHKGHRVTGGHDAHGHVGQQQALRSGHRAAKKWVFHHGHPARTVNLLPVDRRADKYAHGPLYFG